jgi:hypothetical protein
VRADVFVHPASETHQIGRNRYRDSPLRGVPLLIALRLGKVSIAERRESREAVGYDGSSRIFFDH